MLVVSFIQFQYHGFAIRILEDAMEEKSQNETPAEQDSAPQAMTDENPVADPAAQPAFPKQEEDIDLNTLYPDEDGDLNALFPEQEIKTLLKKIQKSKKDLSRMKDRFVQDKDLMP